MKPQIIVVVMGQSVTTEKFASDLAASLTFISAMIVVVNATRRCECPHPLPALQLHLTQDTQGISFVRGLPYVWGSTDKPQSIVIDNHELLVTTNLHAALRRLRDCSIERVIWIDALCSNQESKDERARQIQLISKIYSQAARVVVWLGDAADNSDHALETTRTAASIKSKSSLREPSVRREIEKLLKRPWFRRIWVRA